MEESGLGEVINLLIAGWGHVFLLTDFVILEYGPFLACTIIGILFHAKPSSDECNLSYFFPPHV